MRAVCSVAAAIVTLSRRDPAEWQRNLHQSAVQPLEIRRWQSRQQLILPRVPARIFQAGQEITPTHSAVRCRHHVHSPVPD